MVDMYDDLSSDYDRFVNWPQRLAYEIPLLAAVLPETPHKGKARVLDTACGTGQHAIALAKLGHETVGADLSTEMIAIAKRNASSSGVEIPFFPAGFGQIAPALKKGGINSDFDALLCLGNSLPHVIIQEDLLQALTDFHACLRPGGILIIQNRNFDAVLTTQHRWMEPQAHHEGDREWIFLRFYDFLEDGLIRFNILTLTRQGHHSWQQRHTSTMLMPQTMEMLTQTLEKCGFTITRRLGDLSGSVYDPSSSANIVLIAEKQT